MTQPGPNPCTISAQHPVSKNQINISVQGVQAQPDGSVVINVKQGNANYDITIKADGDIQPAANGNITFPMQKVAEARRKLSTHFGVKIPFRPESDKQSFNEKLGGYTSDHALQTFKIEENDGKNKTTLKGGTWNVLAKCTSQPLSGNFSNNPINYKENDADYKSRKAKQLDELASAIANDEQMAFINLQEVDNITNAKEKAEFEKLLNEKIKEKTGKDSKWKLTNTTKGPPGHGQVTLYNAEKLQLTGSISTVNEQAQDGFRAQISKFTEIGTGKKIAVTNVHLKFTSDTDQVKRKKLKAKLEENNRQLQSQGFLNISAGDTNHTAQALGWVGVEGGATNCDLDHKDKTKNNVTTKVDGTGKDMAYDCSTAMPSNSSATVRVQFDPPTVFKPKNGTVNTEKLKQPQPRFLIKADGKPVKIATKKPPNNPLPKTPSGTSSPTQSSQAASSASASSSTGASAAPQSSNTGTSSPTQPATTDQSQYAPFSKAQYDELLSLYNDYQSDQTPDKANAFFGKIDELKNHVTVSGPVGTRLESNFADAHKRISDVDIDVNIHMMKMSLPTSASSSTPVGATPTTTESASKASPAPTDTGTTSPTQPQESSPATPTTEIRDKNKTLEDAVAKFEDKLKITTEKAVVTDDPWEALWAALELLVEYIKLMSAYFTNKNDQDKADKLAQDAQELENLQKQQKEMEVPSLTAEDLKPYLDITEDPELVVDSYSQEAEVSNTFVDTAMSRANVARAAAMDAQPELDVEGLISKAGPPPFTPQRQQQRSGAASPSAHATASDDVVLEVSTGVNQQSQNGLFSSFNQQQEQSLIRDAIGKGFVKYVVADNFQMQRKDGDENKAAWKAEQSGGVIKLNKPAYEKDGQSRSERQIEMTKTGSGFKLSGSGDNVAKDIGKMALGLQGAMPAGKRAQFTVNAATPEKAQAFIENLAKSGLDVSKLNVNVAGQKQSFDQFKAGLGDKQQAFEQKINEALEQRAAKQQSRATNR